MGSLSEVDSRMLLAAMVEPGDTHVGAAVQKHSAAVCVAAPELLPERIRARVVESRFSELQLTDLHSATTACGATFLTPGHAHWPQQMQDLGVLQPLGLWLLGDPNLVSPAEDSLSIVGARSATEYGESVASELAANVSTESVSVISGGAFGIDAAAHRGALAAGGVTVAILAGGVDVAYPRSNEALFQRIRTTGLLVSESPPGAAPLRHRFLIRNRLIAAWSAGTVVVEARIRSGAIATASHAAGLNRDVMAIPGPINSAASTGCHQLIRDGAVLVTSGREVLELIRGDLPRHSREVNA